MHDTENINKNLNIYNVYTYLYNMYVYAV